MAELTTILHAKAIALGKLAVRATTHAGSGHPTTALSLAHIVTVLMYRAMRWDPKNPGHPGSDRLVLSEGHAVPILYAACADLGVGFMPGGKRRAMTLDDLMSLRDIKSVIDGHPNPALGFPFFDAATGSLGQGLSVAAGLGARRGSTASASASTASSATARRAKGRSGRRWISSPTSGSATSSPSSIATRWARAILCRRRRTGAASRTRRGPSAERAPSTATTRPRSRRRAPAARRHAARHHRPHRQGMGRAEPDGHRPSRHAGEARRARRRARRSRCGARELGADRGSGFADAHYRPARAGADTRAAARARPARARPRRRREEAFAAPRLWPRAQGAGRGQPGGGGARRRREEFDLCRRFAKAFPERYFEGRIAEQNMVSAASGLAAAGKIAFASTFGRFLERGFDQAEMAVIGGLPIKLVGTHVGVTLAADGPSQMGLADIAFMRALAHAQDAKGRPLTVLTPSDAASTYALTLAMAEHDGPPICARRAPTCRCSMARTSRSRSAATSCCAGPAGRRTVMLAAAGYLVHSCLKAARRGAARHRGAVVDAYALPLDAAPLIDIARRSRADPRGRG